LYVGAFACGLAAQQKNEPSVVQPIPENFPQILERVLRESDGYFQSIRSAPLIGMDPSPTMHKFRWRASINLPGAKTCEITELEVRDGKGAPLPGQNRQPSYVCDMGVVAPTRFVPAIEAALGPGWQAGDCDSEAMKSARPPGTPAPICFRKLEAGSLSEYTKVYVGSNSRTEKNIAISVLSSITLVDGAVKASYKDEAGGVVNAIGRIQASSHASLPELQPGSGAGPLTIENETAASLTIYFSGTTDWKEIIPPHSSTHVSLNPGVYKVAGELSDKSVTPFFGVRSYSGGETERFYIAPR
jgi:hypothetical protein